ncbi:Multidrug resistance protein D [Serratia symbiotica]|nr:Multidrug resistance protein D [Serratia symbiotica]
MNKNIDGKIKNLHLLVMLILLVAVGQMAQTIYVPVITKIAHDLSILPGSIQHVMAAYLMTYGLSQLIYGPLSDSIGRRPVILAGMIIFLSGSLGGLLSNGLAMLVVSSAVQGMGIGVAGVMARTLPRDLYGSIALRYVNSMLNMGILISPLLAPLIGGVLAMFFGWRANYAFLLALGAGVSYAMFSWLPETRPVITKKRRMFSSIRELLADGRFTCYLMMMISALSGIVVFEGSCGVLMGDILGLSSVSVSILFILPIPGAFFGSWYAGRNGKPFNSLMWHSVISCLLGGLLMWTPSWFGVMNLWTLIVPATLFFFGAGIMFPLATTGAMEPFPYLAGSAGALVGGMQNLGSGLAALLSATLPQTGQFSVGLLMFAMSLLILICWWPLSNRLDQENNIR